MNELLNKMSDHGLLLFDGDCRFCNGTVMFVAKRDHAGYILYAALESGLGQYLLKEYGLDRNIDSLVYFDKGEIFTRSDGACELASHFKGINRCWYYFKYIPRPLRNWAYDLFAKYRYSLFGKLETCQLPDTDIGSRIIDV
jgi:predicted DCC family thiol-disulfide oxidoreductase YuxK